MSKTGFQQFSRDTIRAGADDGRYTIDIDQLTPAQMHTVPHDLRRFLSDPCSQILLSSLTAGYSDPEARAERYARLKAAREMKTDMKGAQLR